MTVYQIQNHFKIIPCWRYVVLAVFHKISANSIKFSSINFQFCEKCTDIHVRQNKFIQKKNIIIIYYKSFVVEYDKI